MNLDCANLECQHPQRRHVPRGPGELPGHCTECACRDYDPPVAPGGVTPSPGRTWIEGLEPFKPYRTFDTGATRDSDVGKPDYEGYLSPATIIRYGQYMLANQTMADGTVRSGDNWQNKFGRDVLMKSLMRHVVDVWDKHRNGDPDGGLEDALCAVVFNAFGYLFEELTADA